jgi:Xaa-Pro aminopeptidase
MSTGVSTSPYPARLAALRARLREADLDAAVISSLTNLLYLTGFRGTAGALVVLPQQARLVVDFRYVTAARTLVAEDPGLAGVLEIVLAPADLDATVAEVLEGTAAVAVEGDALTVSRYQRLAGRLAAGEAGRDRLRVTTGLVEGLRAVKDAAEIATMREAGRRLAAVAREVVRMPAPGRTEAEVAADIDRALLAAGFSRPAFETIVASGPNAALPHARPTGRRMEPSDGVVLDFGGVYNGYCVDLTRTVQLSPGTDRFRRLHEAVARAQQAALAAIRPGVVASVVDAAARESLDRDGLGEAFGHATGHGLGLDVHEEPRIGRPAAGRPDATLAAGMIFTVEPGAYLAGDGGVRIEDDVLVTAAGYELLTADAGTES